MSFTQIRWKICRTNYSKDTRRFEHAEVCVRSKERKTKNRKTFVFSGGAILNALLNTLSPELVRSQAATYIQMINESNEQYFPKVNRLTQRFSLLFVHSIELFQSILYRSLGLSILLSTPASVPSDLQLLNGVWRVVTKFQDAQVTNRIWIDFYCFS